MIKKIVRSIWRKLSPLARLKIVRVTQTKFTASAAVIIENEKGEILLLDHVLRPDSGWGIPGGFLGFGEQPAEAVRRELIEETGLELEMVEMIRVRVVNRHIEILFRAKANGVASVKSREINAFGWFKVDEMPEKMNQTQKSIIENLL
ncbi:MAG: NUDIX domain-containing protein [Acidobacteriota bacterium]|nr:NUDIX domain-containing protein [Acidobacteriota bacterium]